MRELSMEELRRIQLEILDAVDKFCTEHNINYGLNEGIRSSKRESSAQALRVCLQSL